MCPKNSFFNPLSANPTKWSTHSNNLLPTAGELFECVWPLYGVGAWRVKMPYIFTRFCHLMKSSFLLVKLKILLYIGNHFNRRCTQPRPMCSRLTQKRKRVGCQYQNRQCQWRFTTTANHRCIKYRPLMDPRFV